MTRPTQQRALRGQVFDEQESCNGEQRDAGELLRTLPERRVEPSANSHPDLCDNECLEPDQQYCCPEVQVQETDGEAHRELVEADTDSDRQQREAATTHQLRCALGLAFVLVNEHPDRERREDNDRDVVSGSTDCCSD